MKKLLFTMGFLCSTVTFAAGGQDAILGNGDTFACDVFARSSKVICAPNISSNYHGHVSFSTQQPIVLSAYQVVDCSTLGGDRDVVCAQTGFPGQPVPGQPFPGQPVPQTETRRVEVPAAFNCLAALPNVQHADDLVSDAFIPNRKLVDSCESNRDLSEVRRLQSRGFTCRVDSSQVGQSNFQCVNSLLAKIIDQQTIKGGHRRRLNDVYCAGQVYACTR